MARIVFSKIARLDLKEIVDYIKRDSIKYAYLEQEKIINAIDKLQTQPYLGRIVPELNDVTRELIFKNYRILYDAVSDNRINILSIHHHSRSTLNNPAFRQEE